jgi:hypothetical protein
MTPSQLRAPTNATLKEVWHDLGNVVHSYLDLQDGKCPICQREFTNELRPCIDHEHVRGYKKMKQENKRRFVRGLVCNYDNRRRIPTNSKGITATEIAFNVYQYLTDYDARS